ncbi:DUF3558 domain-containing protein [Amycolatopsis cihanbeyliensis]|uniref:Uncharacterized protein DUF3558 n=1 Tax=Amycolatopsis cihanbeyliensis TaxID=1128664 RepID=A0A542CUW9_AMYCI|nr:DUF3558 domain-containing protein [Amycolatopsis cihanbeyliensis]TQI94617.1 uncharacterized protein DUF3558 [Amycolatopsis cihanbeyliensis]
MTNTGWRTLAGAVGAIALLAGCSGAGEDEPTSRNVLGDLTTLDPCSLAEPDELAEFGHASIDAERDFTQFDMCLVDIDIADDDIGVTVGLLTELDNYPELADNRVREFDDGMWVGQDQGEGWCSQALVFADDVTLDVSASGGDDQQQELCTVAGTAMDTVVRKVRDDAVEQRDPATNSLQSIDACDLLPGGAAGLSPELAQAEQVASPSGQRCRWDPSPEEWDSAYASVRFGYGPEPDTKGHGHKETEIAGRRSVTGKVYERGSRNHDVAFCTVETAHIPFGGAGSPGAVEIAEVLVSLPGTDGDGETMCAKAEQLAGDVWAELPPA